MSEVKQHQTEGSVWTVLKGPVYNIYPYMKCHPGGMISFNPYMNCHPGGVDMLRKAVGKDRTSLFGILCYLYSYGGTLCSSGKDVYRRVFKHLTLKLKSVVLQSKIYMQVIYLVCPTAE
ncbi:hypothetical protein Ancab_006589 [Ancistrocladus abbreviatus]